MVVQELGWDSDTDDALRVAIEDAIDADMVDSDYGNVVDVVLLWWRDEDGDLVDGLVDSLTDLVGGGVIWLLTPKVGRPNAVDAADIVTLDRVICCYPDAEALVGLSAARARTAYGLVLPRDRPLNVLAIGLINVWFRLRRKAYRSYAHPTSRVDDLAAAEGLHPRSERGTFFWRVVVYDRAAQPTGPRTSD